MRARRFFPTLLLPLLLANLPVAAQESGNNPGEQPPPRLAGILDLSSLSLLWDDSPGSADAPDSPSESRDGSSAGLPEPLDITVTKDGPVMLFSDRILSLGFNLEITTRTVQDLLFLPRLPDGVVPSRLLLNPLSEPIIYDSRTGKLVLLHRDGSDPERLETQLPQAQEAESLQPGGVLLSDGKSLSLFTRRDNKLTRREIPLPVAFTSGLSFDAEERLWLYDLAARQARVFDLKGKQLFTVKPDISGATLLFPQIFLTRPDGGFFLGTAGELWCFAADGTVRWRLSQFSAGIRQALPAFYRLAAVRQERNGVRSFYILDPLGNRVLKFIEGLPRGSQDAPGTISSDVALAEAFRSSEIAQSVQNEVVHLCLERQLYLQAAYFRRSGSDTPVVTDLAERLRAKQAGLLSELAEQLEDELRYAEAETAYNRSLSLYRELRNLDPVDPRYPETIRELSEKRNALRQIRLADNLLAARIAEYGTSADQGNQALRITLFNNSGTTVQQLEVQVRFSGYADSSWRAALDTLRAGGRVNLAIPLSPELSSAEQADTGQAEIGLNAEDLHLSCNLLVRYVRNRTTETEYFHLPLVFPSGSLPLPRAE